MASNQRDKPVAEASVAHAAQAHVVECKNFLAQVEEIFRDRLEGIDLILEGESKAIERELILAYDSPANINEGFTLDIRAEFLGARVLQKLAELPDLGLSYSNFRARVGSYDGAAKADTKPELYISFASNKSSLSDMLRIMNALCKSVGVREINPNLDLPFNPASVGIDGNPDVAFATRRQAVLEHIALRIGYAIAADDLERGIIKQDQVEVLAKSFSFARETDDSFRLYSKEIQTSKAGTISEIVEWVNEQLGANYKIDPSSLPELPTRVQSAAKVLA